MADWTTILTTVGAAVVAGDSGYWTARSQGRTEIAKVQAENDRLRMQHREEHLRNRQATYHKLLFEAAKWTYWRSIGAKKEAFPEDVSLEAIGEFNAWLDRVRFAVTGAILF